MHRSVACSCSRHGKTSIATFDRDHKGAANADHSTYPPDVSCSRTDGRLNALSSVKGLSRVTASRYTLRLYWRSMIESQEDSNLDPKDDTMLRSTLERMVHAKRGTLKLDLSEWSLTVHSLGGGRVHARLRVSPSGASEVRR